MILPVSFNVVGLPVPQGSKTIAKARDGRTWLRDDNAKVLKPWRDLVAVHARRAAGHQAPMDGPVVLCVLYRFPMPPSRPPWAHAAGVLLHQVRPDQDKLARALRDGMTDGGVWRDDCLVAVCHEMKVEVADGSWTGVSVRVEQVDPRAARPVIDAFMSDLPPHAG